MSAIKAVVIILKQRFNDLGVEEILDLAEQIVEKVRESTVEPSVIRSAVEMSKCPHGRLHVFCGDCNTLGRS